MGKHQLIVRFLEEHKGKAFYIDVRDDMALSYNSEADFDQHLDELVASGKVFVDEETIVHLQG